MGLPERKWPEQRGTHRGLRRMKAGTDLTRCCFGGNSGSFVRAQARKGRCERPWSEGSPEALHFDGSGGYLILFLIGGRDSR